MQKIKYLVHSAAVVPSRPPRVMDDWAVARDHLVDLLRSERPGAAAEPAVRLVSRWLPGTLRSVGSGPDATTRYLLYPVVEDAGRFRLACPLCGGRLQATEVRHGAISEECERASVTPIGFEQTMSRAYRVYCEEDCAQSGECSNLLDAIDEFLSAVAWPEHVLGTLGVSPSGSASELGRRPGGE